MSDIVKINEVNLRKNEIIRKRLILSAIHPTQMKLVLNIDMTNVLMTGQTSVKQQKIEVN